MTKLRVLDLFSGIGGFSLGLERTGGFETVAFCEIEEFPRKVLRKHWPKVPIYEDVRTLTAERLAADGIGVDVICGGFPCQDISTAGKGAGIAGERSGLWKEYARLIGKLRPQYAIMENVSALLGRGLDVVLGDLAEIGFDAEWHCIPASAVGAPHRRDRVWIVAINTDSRNDMQIGRVFQGENSIASRICETLAHAAGSRLQGSGVAIGGGEGDGPRVLSQSAGNGHGSECQNVADPSLINVKRLITECTDAKGRQGSFERQAGSCGNGDGWWSVEPDVGRVAHGVPDMSHRLKALGNAVVPQIPELIGNAILQSMSEAA